MSCCGGFLLSQGAPNGEIWCSRDRLGIHFDKSTGSVCGMPSSPTTGKRCVFEANVDLWPNWRIWGWPWNQIYVPTHKKRNSLNTTIFHLDMYNPCSRTKDSFFMHETSLSPFVSVMLAFMWVEAMPHAQAHPAINLCFHCLHWRFFLGFFLPTDCNWETVET